MKIRTNGINHGEQYACAPGDVKTLFSDSDIFVWFGLRRNYEFDISDRVKPTISGIVIASMSVNRRETINSDHGMLSFYVIRDQAYSEDRRRDFAKNLLPQLRAWYNNVTLENSHSLPGIETLLVEWVNGSFRLHPYRYA